MSSINKSGTLFEKSLWGLLAVQVTVVFLLSIYRQFGSDEFEATHTAWKILSGEKIYIDFFQHHHPFFYYLLAPFIAVFGEDSGTLIALRMLSFSMMSAMFFVTWRISEKVASDRITRLIAVILLGSSFIFTDSAIEIRPDVPQTLMALLAFLCLFNYFDSKKQKWLIITALLTGVSFLFLQKSIFVIAVIILVLSAGSYKKHIPWTDILIYAAAGLITILPYYIYLSAAGDLKTYYTFNWLLNMKFLNRFSAFNGIGLIFRTNTILAVFYIIGLVFYTRSANQIRLGCISLGLLGSVFLVRAPYNQYFMPAIPFMAVIAANAVGQMIKKPDRKQVTVFVISLAVSVHYLFREVFNDDLYFLSLIINGSLAVIIIGFEKFKKWIPAILFIGLLLPSLIILNRLRDVNFAQRMIVDYVVEVTEPDDYVYDGNASFNLFRKDIDYFWFSTRRGKKRPGALATYRRQIGDYDYDILGLIAKYQPRVIWPYEIDDFDSPVIKDNYVKSEDIGLLYLRKEDRIPGTEN